MEMYFRFISAFRLLKLKVLTNLKSLEAYHTKASQEGFDQLARFLPNANINKYNKY